MAPVYAQLTVVTYPAYRGWAGFLSMALFRLPLWLHKPFSFTKLMGCGKNGTFDITPDWHKWAIMVAVKSLPNTSPQLAAYPAFLTAWWKFFGAQQNHFLLEPIEGHGTWDGKEVFGSLPKKTDYEGRIAILTRATIRLNRLKNFWKHVPAVANVMAGSEGFEQSVGIGEVPWIKQATFSIWRSKADMKNFAYKMAEHAEVVRKTKQENWYSEEMFVRFKILQQS